jgi:AraC-like DNA-binding protein
MLFNDIDTIWVGKFSYEPKWYVQKHSHPFYHIIYVTDGNGFATVNDKNYTLNRDCLIFCPPSCEHRFSAHDNKHLRTIEVKFNLHNSDIEVELQNISGIFISTSKDIRILFEKIVDDVVKKEYLYRDFLAVRIYTILLLLLKKKNSERYNENLSIKSLIEKHKDFDFEKIFRYIDDNISKSITLNDISTQVGYNSTYLCRIFKKRFGISPIQYVNNYRLEKAKELIMYSDLNLTQIAQIVGFQSIHYFSRLFKKKEGITPSEYKNRIRNSFTIEIKEN